MATTSEVLQILLKVVSQGGENITKLSKQMGTLSKAANSTQKALNNIDAFKNLRKDTLASKKAFADAQGEVKKLATAMKTATGDTSKLQKQFDAAKTKAKALKGEYTSNQHALNQLRTALRSAGVDSTKLGAEQTRLKKSLAATQKQIKALQAVTKARDLLGVTSFKSARKEVKALENAYKTLKKSGKLSAQELKNAYDEMRRKTTELRKEMAGLNQDSGQLSQAFGALTQALAGIMAIAFPVKEAAEFERAMSEVLAISGATEEEFVNLTAVALKMGAETEYTAVQAAEGLKYLSMAGLNATESVSALPSVLQLAQAGAMDLGQAADITTNIMTGFGLAAEDLGRVNDILVQTFTHTNSTLEELGYAFAYVGPIAAGLGVKFEDLAATIGVLHNAGLKGSMAGTSLRSVLDTLFNPTAAEAKQMKELEARLGGVALKIRNSNGDFVGFAGVVRQLQDANLSAAEALKMFGLRAGPGMAALMSVGADAIEEYVRLNELAEGRAASIAKVMKENTVGAARELQSAFSGLMIEIGTKLLPVIEKMIRLVTEVTQDFQGWMQDNPELTDSLVKVAGGVAGVTVALAALKLVTIAATVAKGQLLTKLTALFPQLGATAGAFSATGAIISGFFAVLAAGIAGWAAGRFISDLTMPFDAAGRSIGEMVQVGYAKLGGYFNWLTGASNEANQSVIDGINEEAKARQYKADLAKLESQKEIALQRELKAATAEISAEIEKTNDAWKAVSQKLQQVQSEYDNLVSGAEESLKKMGPIIEEQVNGAWDNVDSGKAVQALEAQLAEMERAYDTFDQARLQKASAIELQISQAKQAAIGEATQTSVALLDQQYQKETALAEAQHTTELALIERTSKSAEEAATRKTAAEEKYKTKAITINQAAASKKEELYKKARAALERELDKSLAKEKATADKIKAINEEVADSKKSSEEKIRELKRSTMSESEAYADKEKQVQELIQQASQVSSTDTQKAIELYKEAQSVASTMGEKVTDGEKVVVSQNEAVNKAIGLINTAQQGMEAAASARTSALESSLSATQNNTEAIRDQIGETDSVLDGLKDQIAEGLTVQLALEEGDFAGQIEKLTEAREVMVSVQGEFSDVAEQLKELNAQKLEIQQATEMRIEARFDDAKAELDALYGKVASLDIEQSIDVAADTTQAKAELATVTKKLEALDGKTYTSYHKVKSEMSASSAKPTTEKIKELEGKFAALADVIETEHTQSISMTGDTGTGAVALTTAMSQITSAFDSLQQDLEHRELHGDVSFADQQTSLQQQAKLVTAAYDQLFDGMSAGVEEYGVNFEDVMNDSAAAASAMAESVIADGEAMIQSLASEIESLASEIASIEAEISSTSDSTAEKIRVLNQNMMSDYEIYLDDKARANELYEQGKAEMEAGNYKTAKELMLESQEMAESLAREVTDANGDVLVYLEDSTVMAAELVQQAGDGAVAALNNQKSALEEQQDLAQQQLEATETMVAGMETMVASLEESFASAMDGLADEIAAAMAEVEAVVEEPMEPSIDTTPIMEAYARLADESAAVVVQLEEQLHSMSDSVGAYVNQAKTNTRQMLREAESDYKRFMKKAGQSTEATVNFTATGSTKAPITEKIAEISGKMAGMTDQTPDEFRLNFTDESGTPLLDGIKGKIGAIGSLMGGSVALQASGSWGSLADMDLRHMGSLDLTANGKTGKIIGKTDVLRWVTDLIQDQKRRGVR